MANPSIFVTGHPNGGKLRSPSAPSFSTEPRTTKKKKAGIWFWTIQECCGIYSQFHTIPCLGISFAGCQSYISLWKLNIAMKDYESMEAMTHLYRSIWFEDRSISTRVSPVQKHFTVFHGLLESGLSPGFEGLSVFNLCTETGPQSFTCRMQDAAAWTQLLHVLTGLVMGQKPNKPGWYPVSHSC